MTQTRIRHTPDTDQRAEAWFAAYHNDISDARLLDLHEMWANPYGPPEPARLRLLTREVERRGLAAR